MIGKKKKPLTQEELRQQLYSDMLKLMFEYQKESEGDHASIDLKFKEDGYLNNVTIGIQENN